MNILNTNLNLYKSFYYVAKYEGFTNASNNILLSQSTLSNNIKVLETELGFSLFERNKNKVTLTSQGNELYKKIESIIDIISSNEDKDELRIGTLRFIADNYLCDTIKIFKEKYSNIKIVFDFSDSTELFRKLRKDELDIVLCRYPLLFNNFEKIEIKKLRDVNNCFVCSKEYYEKEKLLMKDENYVYNFILPNSSEKSRIVLQYLIDKNINYKVLVELPNSVLLKKLILNNVGIGYINEKFVSDELNNGTMIKLEQFINMPIDNISIIYSNKNNKHLMEFIDLLKETI